MAYVLMHWRAHSAQMQQHTDVRRRGRRRGRRAAARGSTPPLATPASTRRRVAVDPGIGFSKTADQNWDVLAGMERLHELGHPVLIATSRKRFLGALLADASGELRPPELREDGTTATSALAAVAGAWCIRTHEVRPTLDAVLVAAALGGPTAGAARELTGTQEHRRGRGGQRRRSTTAFETADLDTMQELWLDDPETLCVHPGALPVRGTGPINRSWALIMANTPYIQFFLTDVEVSVLRRGGLGDLHRERADRRRDAPGPDAFGGREGGGHQRVRAHTRRLAVVDPPRLPGTVGKDHDDE